MGVVRTVKEIAESDWAEARGAIVEVDDRGGGSVDIPNSPWHFTDAVTGVRGRTTYRGEDNRDVFSRLLGLDDETLDRLEADGVLSSRVPDALMPARSGHRPDEGGDRAAATGRPTTTRGPTRSSGTATARSRSSTAAAVRLPVDQPARPDAALARAGRTGRRRARHERGARRRDRRARRPTARRASSCCSATRSP